MERFGFSMGNMFKNATIDNIDLSSFNLSNLEDVGHMFEGVKTENINISTLTGKTLGNEEYGEYYSEPGGSMFLNVDVKTIDISGLDTSLPNLQPGVTDPDSPSILVDMFSGTKASTVYVKSQGDINRLQSKGFDTKPPVGMQFQIK